MPGVHSGKIWFKIYCTDTKKAVNGKKYEETNEYILACTVYAMIQGYDYPCEEHVLEFKDDHRTVVSYLLHNLTKKLHTTGYF